MIKLEYDTEYDDLFHEFYCYWIECPCGCDIKEAIEDIAEREENEIICNACKARYKIIGQDKRNLLFMCISPKR